MQAKPVAWYLWTLGPPLLSLVPNYTGPCHVGSCHTVLTEHQSQSTNPYMRELSGSLVRYVLQMLNFGE